METAQLSILGHKNMTASFLGAVRLLAGSAANELKCPHANSANRNYYFNISKQNDGVGSSINMICHNISNISVK